MPPKAAAASGSAPPPKKKAKAAEGKLKADGKPKPVSQAMFKKLDELEKKIYETALALDAVRPVSLCHSVC